MKTIFVATLIGRTTEFIPTVIDGKLTVTEVLRSVERDCDSDIWALRVDGVPAMPNTLVTEANSLVAREKATA